MGAARIRRIPKVGSSVDPYYAPIDPTLVPYTSTFSWDLLYYGHDWSYWDAVPLPTPEMLSRALPEGVIQPGVMVSGFLDFGRVEPGDRRVRLQAELMSADSGDRFGEVSIPFDVAAHKRNDPVTSCAHRSDNRRRNKSARFLLNLFDSGPFQGAAGSGSCDVDPGKRPFGESCLLRC